MCTHALPNIWFDLAHKIKRSEASSMVELGSLCFCALRFFPLWLQNNFQQQPGKYASLFVSKGRRVPAYCLYSK